MNGRTAKLLRRAAKLAAVMHGAGSPTAHLPNLKRSWRATPRPERHAARQALQAALEKHRAANAKEQREFEARARELARELMPPANWPLESTAMTEGARA